MKFYDDSGNELVLVRKDWLEYQTIYDECPFCGSDNIIDTPETKELASRRGCKSCDNWFEPQLLR